MVSMPYTYILIQAAQIDLRSMVNLFYNVQTPD